MIEPTTARQAAVRPQVVTRRRPALSSFEVLRAGIILAALVVVLLPFVSLISDSLKPDLDFLGGPRLFPSRLTLENYAPFVKTGSPTMKNLWNSLVVTFWVTVICVTAGSLAAYALSRLPYRWVSGLTLAMVAVRFYPKITTLIPFFMMMRSFGLLDTKTSIVIAHLSFTLPLVILLMETFYREIPKELEEAAWIDGASIYSTFFRVVVPLTLPGMATSAILTALLSWNEFLMASALARKEALTLPIAVAANITDKGIDWGNLSAMSVVICVPMILFLFLTQRALVRGLTMGAVKG
jgi:multiple sugar transport system permease protein